MRTRGEVLRFELGAEVYEARSLVLEMVAPDQAALVVESRRVWEQSVTAVMTFGGDVDDPMCPAELNATFWAYDTFSCPRWVELEITVRLGTLH